ncbi:unnamed protein product [Ranitomeya imitator]|uniref:Importin N-terminal domain-containing protein n=1 Tax=Ranitomeya imitator TaxID=111125 RepID=A0ABN9KTC5_9NEOB|nr:unnamed protein product [Ranitomeya imitator]
MRSPPDRRRHPPPVPPPGTYPEDGEFTRPEGTESPAPHGGSDTSIRSNEASNMRSEGACMDSSQNKERSASRVKVSANPPQIRIKCRNIQECGRPPWLGFATMELSDANLQALTEYLRKTLDPDPAVRRPAEKYLESVEANLNYPLLLLTLVERSQDNVIKVCSSVTFKNYIKRNWRVIEDEPNKICETDRVAIKANIVNLMLSSPEQIQKQLSDAISIIGREDFPQKWPDLLTEMVNRFQSGDFHVINGVLHTAHSLFKRYRHEFKSSELWTEIKLVLDTFALPLTNLFQATIGLCNTHANDVSALKVLFSSLILIAKLFYSLNFQDLPEFFEDNMETWMTNFHSLLTLDNKLLQTEDEEEAGLLELLKSQICDNAALYAQKYDEEFQAYLPRFVTAIWNLLVTTGQEVKYDLLVSNAIQFLASVCERPHYKNLFEDPSTLTSICEKVIVPNMEFRGPFTLSDAAAIPTTIRIAAASLFGRWRAVTQTALQRPTMPVTRVNIGAALCFSALLLYCLGSGKQSGDVTALLSGSQTVQEESRAQRWRTDSAADEEAFEDNSEEYIRRDLEGSGNVNTFHYLTCYNLTNGVTDPFKVPISPHHQQVHCLLAVHPIRIQSDNAVAVPYVNHLGDIDTRRRAACDLVRGLCKFFEGPVTNIFSCYVSSMLQEYAKNPSVNWKHKDAAIYLVTSLASKAQTQKV